MSANVGTLDRIVRLFLGAALILLPLILTHDLFTDPLYKFGTIAVGIILAATAGMRFCPLYRIAGIRTCKHC